MLLASQAEDPGQGSSYWFCMAALGGRGLWRPPLLSEPGVPFVPRSIRLLGLLFLTLRHESTLVVEHRILGFLYGAAVRYSTKTLSHRRGVSRGDR
jgi:hypothetical protein